MSCTCCQQQEGKTCWEEKTRTKQATFVLWDHTQGFSASVLLTLRCCLQLLVGESLPCAKDDWQQLTVSAVTITKNICRHGQTSSGVLGGNSPRLRTIELHVVLVHSPSFICNSTHTRRRTTLQRPSKTIYSLWTPSECALIFSEVICGQPFY